MTRVSFLHILCLCSVSAMFAALTGCSESDPGSASSTSSSSATSGASSSSTAGGSGSTSAVTYDFIETSTGKTLGTMRVLSSVALEGGWTTTDGLVSILDGGLAGIQFSFPDQGAPDLGVGTSGDLPAFGGEAYGSSNGEILDINAVSGGIDGFAAGNKLAVLTFDPAGVGGMSVGSSATTAFNNAVEGGTGIVQTGSGGHNDKYMYVGVWTREN